MKLEEMIRDLNEALRSKILCIHPYQMYNTTVMQNRVEEYTSDADFSSRVLTRHYDIRAWLMENRYKLAKPFQPFLSVFEGAFAAYMQGNFVVAYLSLMPCVEAIVRKWAALECGKPNDDHHSVKSLTDRIVKEWCKDKIGWIHAMPNMPHIAAMVDSMFKFIPVACEKLFENTLKYPQTNGYKYSRQYALHYVEGISDSEKLGYNLARLILLLDCLAELYILANETTWKTTINMNIEWQYIYRAMVYELWYVCPLYDATWTVQGLELTALDNKNAHDMLQRIIAVNSRIKHLWGEDSKILNRYMNNPIWFNNAMYTLEEELNKINKTSICEGEN